MEEFELALTVTDCNKVYKYYVNENESDENENTKLYSNNKLLSDNYLATNDLMDTLIKINNGEIKDYTMSAGMVFNYQEMMKQGYFED